MPPKRQPSNCQPLSRSKRAKRAVQAEVETDVEDVDINSDVQTEVETDAKLVAKAAAQLKGSAKTKILHDTSVPLPDLKAGPQSVLNSRRAAALERGFKRNAKLSAGLWSRFAPIFRIPEIQLSQLAARPKPCKKDQAQAQQVMDDMSHWEADAFSAKICDSDGSLIAAYFANRHVTHNVQLSPALETCARKAAPEYRGGPLAPSELGRSTLDLLTAQEQGAPKLVYDGIPPKEIEDALWATQVLHHFLQPQKSAKDGRHDWSDFLMKYSKDGKDRGAQFNADYEGPALRFTHEGLVYQFSDEQETSERTGVSHLVHAWQSQGHHGKKTSESPFRPSADMFKNGQVAMAVDWYMRRTRKLALVLSCMFEEAFPEERKIYQKAFDAGVWLEIDPGPWLGRAIVWKLNVLPHRDGQDAGPAAIFCMGNFTGGELYLTDLKIKLRYRPGDVLIFRAGDLYHSVGNWEPVGGITPEGITPGRVGNVFFSPAHAVEALKDKDRLWLKKNAGGLLESIQ